MKTRIKKAIKNFNCLEIYYADSRILNINCDRLKLQESAILADCIFSSMRISFCEISDIKGYYFNNPNKFSILQKFDYESVSKIINETSYNKIKILYDEAFEIVINKKAIKLNKKSILVVIDFDKTFEPFFKVKFNQINDIEGVFK